jgi:hypothetical protein
LNQAVDESEKDKAEKDKTPKPGNLEDDDSGKEDVAKLKPSPEAGVDFNWRLTFQRFEIW